MNRSSRLANGAVVRQSFLSGGMASVAVATGLLLDVVAAAVFGAGRDTDAFVVAARFPLAITAIMMLLGNQVLVPTFTTWESVLNARRVRRLVSTTLLAAVLVAAAGAAVLAAAADPIVAVMAPGFQDSQQSLSADLMRVMVATIPLTAGCEVLRAWLNARHRFAVPAAMTVVLNLVAVGVVVLVPGDIAILPLAYVAGAVAQLVLMLLYAVARGLRLGLPTPGDSEVTSLVALLVRPSVAATLNPLARAAETFVASFMPPGSATVLHYGHRLIHAIGGTVLFRSIMIALLPRLTRAYLHGDQGDPVQLGRLGLRLMVAVSFPLTALAVVLAVPASEAVFGRGRFSAEDARMLGIVLAVLALSLPLSAIQRALLLPFYAVRDTKAPLRNSLAGAVASLVALPVLVLPVLDTGLALPALAATYVLSNVVNVLHARRSLGRSGLAVPGIRPRHVLQSLLAAATGGAVAWAVLRFLPDLRIAAGYDEMARVALAGLAALVPVLVPGAVARRRRGRARRRADGAPEPVVTREPDGRHVHVRTEGVDLRLHPVLTTAVGVATGIGATLTTIALVEGWGRMVVVAPAGLLLGAGLVSLALARFEMFVLALLVSRASLDALKFGSSSVLDPAALVGMLFLGAGVVWLLAQWREAGRIELGPLGRAAVAFAGAAAIGGIVAPAYWPALVEWTRVASVCVMLLVVERAARKRLYRRQVVAAAAAAAAVPLVVAAWQAWSGAGLFDAGGFGRVRGTFTHSNPLAAFLALLVVMAFAYAVHLRAPRGRAWAWAVLGVCSLGLFATYTRAAWLAALVGILVVAGSLGRRALAVAAAVLVAVVLTVPGVSLRFSDLAEDSTARGEPGNSLTWRTEYWGDALDLAATSPITGIGLKQVAAQTLEGKQPHNDFLRAYVELGLLGLAAYLWLTWQILATGVRSMRATRAGPPEDRALAVGYTGAAAGYVLMSLVANLMSQVVVGFYFAAFAGAAAALLRHRTEVPAGAVLGTVAGHRPRLEVDA